MMFRGTQKYPADVYQDILKKAGADQSGYTTDDYTNYHITFTKDDLEKVIEIEADRFMNLSYSEEAFRTEALAVKGEYLKNFSNPLSKMRERISDMMFTSHTYKHTTMGFIEDIEAMPDQLEYSHVFFDRWYRPENPSGSLRWSLSTSAGAWYEVALTHGIPFRGDSVTFVLGVHEGQPARSGTPNPIDFTASDRCLLSEPGVQPSFTVEERRLEEKTRLAVVEVEEIPWIDGRRKFPVELTVEGSTNLEQETGVEYWNAYLSGHHSAENAI